MQASVMDTPSHSKNASTDHQIEVIKPLAQKNQVTPISKQKSMFKSPMPSSKKTNAMTTKSPSGSNQANQNSTGNSSSYIQTL